MEDRYPDGLYLTFARFRDASHDIDPPRYEPCLIHGVEPGQRVIRDEREWLARPDLWGVDVLPVHKSELAEHYSAHWLADVVVKCPVCSPLICELWPTGYFDHSVLDASDWRDCSRQTSEANQRLRNRRVDCLCDDSVVFNRCWQYAKGVLAADEMMNAIWAWMFGRANNLMFHGAEAEWQRFRQAAWEYGRQLALELCGPNPFRPVAFRPAWRTEHTVGIAAKMYEDRDFAAMPILADALEEAGCESEAILTHCREPGVHVRGCWVVDLVLGKA